MDRVRPETVRSEITQKMSGSEHALPLNEERLPQEGSRRRKAFWEAPNGEFLWAASFWTSFHFQNQGSNTRRMYWCIWSALLALDAALSPKSKQNDRTVIHHHRCRPHPSNDEGPLST